MNSSPEHSPSEDELEPVASNDPTDPSAADRPAPVRPRRVLRSLDLLQGEREVWIEHGDEVYRLRLTSRGKLYLTK